MIRAVAMVAILRFVVVLSAPEADNVQPFIGAFDKDGWRAVFEFQNNRDRERFVEVHLDADSGELAPGSKDGGAVDFNWLSNLVREMNEHRFLEVIQGQLFETDPNGCFRPNCR